MNAPTLPPLNPAAFGPVITGTDALPLPCDQCGAGTAEPCEPVCRG